MILTFFSKLFSKNKNINNPKDRYSHRQYFQNSEHQTLLDIKNKQHLAKGNSAEILSTTIEFKRPTQKGHIISKNKNFVLKCYDNEKNRNLVYNNWKNLNNLKFPTFTTYRKYEKTQILMTNLSSQTQFCTSSNNLDDSLDADFLIKNQIQTIENFNDFLNSSIQIIQKAKQNNLYIDDSAYFFIGQKNQNKSTKLELFLGDLDFINKFYNPQVILELKTAIKGFIIFFVEKKYQQIYLNSLENKFKKL